MIDWQWAEVDRLESQERWNEAKSLLLATWRQNPNDVKVTIRLGFFCWYVIVEHFPRGITDVDLLEMDAMLKEVTQYGLTHFMTDEDFLWCYGYMMALFPFYFGDEEYWEAKGMEMLKLAYELFPDEPVYRYSYFYFSTPTKWLLKIDFQHLQVVLEDRFQGKGLLAEYFKSVWHHWHEG